MIYSFAFKIFSKPTNFVLYKDYGSFNFLF